MANSVNAAFGNTAKGSMKYTGNTAARVAPTVRKAAPPPVEEDVPPGFTPQGWTALNIETKAQVMAALAVAKASVQAPTRGFTLKLGISPAEYNGVPKTPTMTVRIGSRRFPLASLYHEEAEFMFGEGEGPLQRFEQCRAFFRAHKHELPKKGAGTPPNIEE